jgi:glycosyltransferase involved in cell wall biosynthesis
MIKEHLTIVIPCKNEEDYILKTLYSIEKQEWIGGTRVIIADANSTDSTRRRIKEYQEHSLLNIEVIDGGSVSFGRNVGAKLCDTQYILFMDADSHLFENDTIFEAMFQLMFYSDLVTCKLKCTHKILKANIVYRTFNIIQRLLPESFSTGVFMMVNRDEFNRIGGFNEDLHQSEDYINSQKPSVWNLRCWCWLRCRSWCWRWGWLQRNPFIPHQLLPRFNTGKGLFQINNFLIQYLATASRRYLLGRNCGSWDQGNSKDN